MAETITFGGVALCASGDIVENFNLDAAPSVQDMPLARAPTADSVNRGNRRRVFSFRVKKAPKATPPDARMFMIDHEIALAALDLAAANQTVTFVYGSKTYTLAQATCTHRASQSGVTSIHEYTISGGALAAS